MPKSPDGNYTLTRPGANTQTIMVVDNKIAKCTPLLQFSKGWKFDFFKDWAYGRGWTLKRDA